MKNRRLTWNPDAHGLYVPGLLVWGTVLAECLSVAGLTIYALCRLAMWVMAL